MRVVDWPTTSTSSYPQQIEPALPEILGQRSAASLATGPVIPEPFISPLLLTMTAALSRARKARLDQDVASLCNNELTFKVNVVAFSPAERLALTDDDGHQHLLSELGLTFLHTSKELVSDWANWHSVQPGSTTGHSDHVQVLSSSVIGAVHHRGDWQTSWNLHLDTVASSSS